jgi:hypothetical protein
MPSQSEGWGGAEREPDRAKHYQLFKDEQYRLPSERCVKIHKVPELIPIQSRETRRYVESMCVWRAALAVLLTTSIATPATAQHPAPNESVSAKVINPIAFLMKFTVENQYSPSLWNSRGEANDVQGEIVIPFEAFAKQNLARIRIFFETSSPGGTRGLSELQVIDLILFHRGWGTFGAGVTSQLTPQTSDRRGTISPGPAFGAVVERRKWRYGFLNQNFFSGNVAETDLQPILAYEFNDKWSAEIGDVQYIYDWKRSRVTSIPISAQLNRMLLREKESLQLSFQAEYNLKNTAGLPMWTLTAGVTLIPKQ